ncbi:MAG: hypothetical protein JXR94_00445, partial [Candidatus Hydrogenedentes bacterium]|nr:hypothetical protein [Candidatus Hydrogenedentota bacterium]
ARQLNEAGEEARLVAVFDCPVANGRKRRSGPIARWATKLWALGAGALRQGKDALPYIRDGLYLLASKARRPKGDARASVVDFFRWRIADGMYRYMLRKADVARLVSDNQGLELLELPAARRVFATLGANMREHKRYVAQPYRGSVSLFRTESSVPNGQEADPSLGWSAVAQGGVEPYDVPGNHAAIFAPPYVQVLAERLGDAIRLATPPRP